MKTLREQLGDDDFLRETWQWIYLSKKQLTRIDNAFNSGKSNLERFKNEEKKIIPALSQAIHSGRFIFSSHRAYWKPKQDRKNYRLIVCPDIVDRIVHKALFRILKPIITPKIFPKNEISILDYPLSPGRVRALNARRALTDLIRLISRKYYFLLQSDFKDFFHHIPKVSLFQQITALVPDHSVDDLIKQIIYCRIKNLDKLLCDKTSPIPMSEESGIIMGSSVTLLFANLYLRGFDDKIREFSNNAYLRPYTDDFLVATSHMDGLSELLERVKSIADTYQLLLSESKTKLIDLRQERLNYMGFNISRSGIFLRKTDGEILEEIRGWLDFGQYIDIFINTKHIPKITHINCRITDWYSYYSCAHNQVVFEKINSLLAHFRRTDHRYRDLIDTSSLRKAPVIDQNTWQSYFKR